MLSLLISDIIMSSRAQFLPFHCFMFVGITWMRIRQKVDSVS
jgi:hypothetical protein